MPFHRLRRLIQGQGGSTLVEMLVAMPLAVALLGAAVHGLGVTGVRQQDVERRSQALTTGQIGLERMTRELRQAGWLYFRSSAVVDIDALVRSNGTTRSVHRLVRYDCSTSACVRREGPAVAFPPPAQPAFQRSQPIVGSTTADVRSRDGRVVGHDVFRPGRIDPQTGKTLTDFVTPDVVRVRLRLQVDGRSTPIELEDGVTLRNRGAFK